MNCFIFDVHIDCCFSHDNSRYDLLELGPLNIVDPNLFTRYLNTSIQIRNENGDIEISITEH